MNTATNSIEVKSISNRIEMEEPVPVGHSPHAMGNGRATSASPPAIQWSWACRQLASVPLATLQDAESAPPVPGDVALIRVERTQFHKHLTTAENRRMRLYPGAQFIGVFGNRYACDAFEAEVLGPDHLS